MSMYRTNLPQINGERLLTDSGLETDLVFNQGVELPAFAAFPLIETEVGREQFRRWYRLHLAIAARHGTGFVLETPTWRSNPDWGAQLGYSQSQLDEVDRACVDLMLELRESSSTVAGSILVSGQVGPRGDGYAVGTAMTAVEAESYHARQVGNFAATECDLVSMVTVTYADEAIGFVQAARAAEIPAMVSFTVETDGLLPDGMPLRDAINAVDTATDGYVAYFGINCAHPDHFRSVLKVGGGWTSRLGSIRANASRLSHAQLDEAAELDDGDPVELAALYGELAAEFPSITVFGGCCGTDARHVAQIAQVLAPV